MADFCRGTNKDGTQCAAPAQPGREWCYFHDPQNTEKLAASRTLGGINRKIGKRGEYPGPCEDLASIKRWLTMALDDTYELDNSVRRSAALAGLLRIASDVIGAHELKKEIREVKEVLNDSRKHD